MITPPSQLLVSTGPVLLAGIEEDQSYPAHRARTGEVARVSTQDIVAMSEAAAMRGRGGAGFPFAIKIAAAAKGRRPVVVVNAAEGEPASAKDSALMRTVPHLVLDGALVAARALGAKQIHVVTSEDRPDTEDAVDQAIDERPKEGVRWHHHHAEGRFVSGQARAVIELMSGREGLPVTSWKPEAMDGYKGRPTLLSNTETFAHLAALVRSGPQEYAARGTASEPGTTLLTISTVLPGGLVEASAPHVIEVEHGVPFASVLTPHQLDAPALLGGYHGTWVGPGRLRELTVSHRALRELGLTIGAGVVLPLTDGSCPVLRTADLATYLAQESAGRCGPCMFGLPALAQEIVALAAGSDTRRRITELAGVVERRGACAHPDGTARLARSLLALEDVVEAHLDGDCSCGPRAVTQIRRRSA